jgi:L-serine dehydratase
MPGIDVRPDRELGKAQRIAMRESGEHKVSLDQVIKTMYETGRDMQTRYKETS